MTDGPGAVADLARERSRDDGRPTVVALTGPVASGKSTFADAVAERARAQRRRVEVVSTDGFLRPNAWLAERGLLAHKGYPETYDVAALRAFVASAHAGATELSVPVYSHEIYDVVPDAAHRFDAPDVLVIEGLNALSALGGHVELGVYLHAPPDALEAWYLERFRRLCAEAVTDPSSFYRTFVDRSPDEIDALARSVWHDVNAVNNREHVEPSRAHADCVVVLDADHEVVAVEVRGHDPS